MNRTKIVVPFELIPGNEVPIIKFYLDKEPRYAIIDTGAESTVFDKSIRHLLTITSQDDVSIVGLSGENESSMIETAKTKIWMHNNSKQIGILNVCGFITDLSHLSSHFLRNCNDKKLSAILGTDMLNEFNADIDFINQEVTFKL